MYVDFSSVPEAHAAMHARLENWGRACHGRPGDSTSPMFRLFRAGADVTPYAASTRTAVDHHDAHRIGLGVYHLPDPHRLSLHWYYVQRWPVIRARRLLACTAEALHRYVTDGRSMLINRGV